MRSRTVLAYSGAREAQAIIAAIAEIREAEVIAVTLDMGQEADLEEVRDRALAAGAARAHVLDVRDEFARDYVLPSLHAHALRNGRDPMPLALARPLVYKKLREIAAIEQAASVIESFDMDANLWGRVGNTFTTTTAPAAAPDTAAHVELAFEKGIPTCINGVPLRLTELIESLSIIAGRHGVGRIDQGSGDQGSGVPDPRSPVPGSGSWIEAPAAVVLHGAHAALETFALSEELVALKGSLGSVYADIVWNSGWCTPAREALDAFNATVQEHVTGLVRLHLLKGQYAILECASLRTDRRVTSAAGAAVPPS